MAEHDRPTVAQRAELVPLPTEKMQLLRRDYFGRCFLLVGHLQGIQFFALPKSLDRMVMRRKKKRPRVPFVHIP
jgi:hypothetical protein